MLEDPVAALEAVVEAYPDDVDPSLVGSAAGPSAGTSRRWLCSAPRPVPRRCHRRGTGFRLRLYDTHYSERYLGTPCRTPSRTTSSSP